jgi:hypothetical protein
VVIASSVDTTGAFSTGSDTVNMHLPTEGSDNTSDQGLTLVHFQLNLSTFSWSTLNGVR